MKDVRQDGYVLNCSLSLLNLMISTLVPFAMHRSDAHAEGVDVQDRFEMQKMRPLRGIIIQGESL